MRVDVSCRTILDAEERIAERAVLHGVYPSMLVGNEARMERLMAKGVHSFTVGRDRNILMRGMKDLQGRYMK